MRDDLIFYGVVLPICIVAWLFALNKIEDYMLEKHVEREKKVIVKKFLDDIGTIIHDAGK